MSEKLTTDQFVKRAKMVHSDKYSYSVSTYTSAHVKIKIECKEHGLFEQTAYSHLRGAGCKKCSLHLASMNLLHTTDEFVRRAEERHGKVYVYEKTVYVGSGEKVIITCKKHGDFKQLPSNHLNGSGCKKCATYSVHEQQMVTYEEFVERSSTLHQNKYTYPQQLFSTIKDSIGIVCPIHGKFRQIVGNHLQGAGCNACAVIENTQRHLYSHADFLSKANLKHNGTYDYSLAKYEGCSTKVKIGCHTHGVFEQAPTSHLFGQGCPKCASERVGGWKIKPNEENIIGTLYLVKLVNNDERFIKIGITKHDVRVRMRPICMHKQYKYEVLVQLTDRLINIFKTEQDFKKMFKKNKYIPKIKFGGHSECFKEEALVSLLGCFHKYNNVILEKIK